MPDNFEGSNVKLSKYTDASIEKMSSPHKFFSPNLMSHPFTLNKVLVSISLKIMALGSPSNVSMDSG